MTIHTIIPDIHADATRLNASLEAANPNGKLLFLGDFIDAGETVKAPDDLSALKTVRTLIDEGKALAVMGNHELNAILYHRFENGTPLREHSNKNNKQHQSFIDAFGVGTDTALEWTEWFLTALPLWREFEGLRLVHACWSERQIDVIKERRPDGYLKQEDLKEVASETTPFGMAVKTLLTGPEVELPEPFAFHDHHGNRRREVRLAWWNAGARTWPEATLSVPNPSELPESEMPSDAVAEIYHADAPPVLVGHYKMKGEPRIEHPKAASIDYPNTPCIYRWSGEGRLSEKKLVKL